MELSDERGVGLSIMSSYCFSIESMIRGYHVYKNIWDHPSIDKELWCKREPGNPSDPSSLAILIADGGTILLNVPSGSGNNSSEAVFGARLKYFRIHINTEINNTENTDCGCT